MSPERISAEVSVAVAAVKARMATEGRVYPAPLAGNPEAMAEVERFDVAAVGRRLKSLLHGIAVVRLPGELP